MPLSLKWSGTKWASKLMKRFLYHYFRFLSSINYWVSRRFTKAGLLVLIGLVASAVLGLDTNRTMAYQAFSFLVFLLLVSLTSSLFYRARLSVRRVLPRFGTVGQALTYRIFVQNHGPQTQDGLFVRENLADPRPTFEEFTTASDATDRHRNWQALTVDYPRWRSLVTKNQPAVIEEQPLARLVPESEHEVQAELTPLRRGCIRFTGLTVARPDPFGLFKGFVTHPLPDSLMVLPKRYPVPSIHMAGTRMYHHGGVALASSIGDSEEFVSLREYRPGDPLRRLHWKSWARAGEPIVKEYQDEFFVRHGLILDTFQSNETEAFEEAVSVAASFACTVQTQESLLDLMFVGPEAYCVTAGRGVGQVAHLLEVLACARPCSDKSFEALHALVVQRGASLSGCICILLTWNEERQELVKHLQMLDIPTLVLLIIDGALPDDLPSGAMAHRPGMLHRLEVGKIAEGLASL